jgi:hypothetical protein
MQILISVMERGLLVVAEDEEEQRVMLLFQLIEAPLAPMNE